ncbi:ankyrin repeat-containing domain protein [Mycena capillaripes]|nr:ankyrin repeat-containing domain protein [Mycena capillaripes]
MPDPFSLLGLVASILQFVDTIVKTRDYVVDFHDAPKDQRDFLAEVQSLEPLLQSLETRLRVNKSLGMVNGVQQFEEPLVRLKKILERLTKELDTKSGVTKYAKRLIWPLWRKKDIQDGLNAIERFKTLLGTWLAIGIWKGITMVSFNRFKVLRSNKDKHIQTRYLPSILSQQITMLFSNRFKALPLNRQTPSQMRYLLSIAFHSSNNKIGANLLESIRGTARKLESYHDGSDTFKAWILGLGTRLWCPGMPGAGKTVLASIVVHHLRKTLRLPDNTGVAVVYLHHKEGETQAPANLLASIWRQLVVRRPISMEVQQLYDEHREPDTKPSLEDFHHVLCSTVAGYSKVYLVVDAVDEYPEEKRQILLDNLSNLGPNINLMLTSRPHINMSATFVDTQILEIRAVAEDIRKYVDAQIDHSPRLKKHVATCPELHEEIETLSVNRSKGMFLLAKLHITSIIAKNTVKAVREALQKMPTGLQDTYREVMQRINEQGEDDKKVAHSTLALLSNAKRLLRVSELREALAVEPGKSELDRDNLLDLDVILSVCAGLVIVDELEAVVRLVHYTTQDYLDSTQRGHFPSAQTDITLICITYLSFSAFTNSAPITPSRSKNLENTYPLLDYAVEYGLIHACGQPELTIRETLLRFLANAALTWVNVWASRHQASRILWSLWNTRLSIPAFFNLQEIARHLISIQETSSASVAFLFAAVNGHQEMISLLIENGADVNAQGPCSGSAIQVASYFGHEAAVAFLIDNGADVNAQGGDYGTALQAAAFRGHDTVVRALVERGADINAQGGRFRTALQASFKARNGGVVQLLLAKGADFNQQEGDDILEAAVRRGWEEIVRLVLNHERYSDAALRWASEHGDTQLVGLLLTNGADVNRRDKFNRSALIMVAKHGHIEVVQLLLVNGADINACSRECGTSLREASSNGHENVVQLLLVSGANPAMQTTALQASSYNGDEDTVRLFLENGADANARDTHGNTALQYAATKGDTNVVQLLLDNGANVQASGGSFGKPLYEASKNGHKEVVRLLLENGTEVNVLNNGYPTALDGASEGGNEEVGGEFWGTALQAASAFGHREIVQKLLANGADINALGGTCGTALYAASTNGHKEVIRLLLENGADVNVGSNDYATALHGAAEHGNEEVVRMLVTNGANVNAQDQLGGTALQSASAFGHREIVQELLLNGADVNALGGEHRTALYAASRKGHTEVVRLLIENGADVNVRDHHASALHGAAERGDRGNEEIVEMLLANGANVNAQDWRGRTALSVARSRDSMVRSRVRFSHSDVVELLLANGANEGDIIW